MTHHLHQGDCLPWLQTLEPNSVDFIGTDPPYAWDFMGADWDSALPDPRVWQECRRVLKPGGSAVVMSGARGDCLWRLMRDLEEGAGFDLQQSLFAWVYRTGFGKGSDLSKEADAGALRAWLRSVPHDLDARDLNRVIAAGVNGSDGFGHGTSGDFGVEGQGGLCEDRARASRLEGARLLADLLARFWEPLSVAERAAAWSPYADGHEDTSVPPGVRAVTGYDPAYAGMAVGTRKPMGQIAMLVDEATPAGAKGWAGDPGLVTAPATAQARAVAGLYTRGKVKPAWEVIVWARKPHAGPVLDCVQTWGTGAVNCDAAMIREGAEDKFPATVLTTGGPLRAAGGLFDLDLWGRMNGLNASWIEAARESVLQVKKPDAEEKDAGCDSEGNPHPTVKPLLLFRFLVALLCPPGGVVLDPYAGSGTTLCAALAEGRDALGAELSPAFAAVAEARIAEYAREA